MIMESEYIHLRDGFIFNLFNPANVAFEMFNDIALIFGNSEDKKEENTLDFDIKELYELWTKEFPLVGKITYAKTYSELYKEIRKETNEKYKYIYYKKGKTTYKIPFIEKTRYKNETVYITISNVAKDHIFCKECLKMMKGDEITDNNGNTIGYSYCVNACSAKQYEKNEIEKKYNLPQMIDIGIKIPIDIKKEEAEKYIIDDATGAYLSDIFYVDGSAS